MEKDRTIKNGVGVLIIENNQVLLAQRINSHGQGEYGSLGGHLEFGEQPQQAIAREIMEEIGVELYELKFLMCLSMQK